MATEPKTPAANVPAVQAPKSTAVAMPGSWKDRLKQVAVQVAEAEKPTGGFISFKSGRLSIGERQMPGDKIECVVVDSLLHNKFFGTEYDSRKVTPPDCYAFAREEHMLAPVDDDVEDIQSESCSGCPRNEWGSSLKGGRGKACTNSRRLFLLPADVINSADKAARTEYLQCDLPATSVINYSKFATEAAQAGMPPFAFVVELSVKPHDNYLFQVHFKPMEQIKDELILEALAKRNWANEQAAFPKYPTKEELAERESGGNGNASKKY